jgi:hypothetical protein
MNPTGIVIFTERYLDSSLVTEEFELTKYIPLYLNPYQSTAKPRSDTERLQILLTIL